MQRCNLQPIASATVLLLLALDLQLAPGSNVCISLTHGNLLGQSFRAFCWLPLLIVMLCHTLAFITSLLTCILETGAPKSSILLRGGC